MTKKQPKKQPKKKPISDAEAKKIASDIGEAIDLLIKTAKAKRTAAATKVDSDTVHTKCSNCNLKLIIPRVESNRCLLCGCKELEIKAWSRG